MQTKICFLLSRLRKTSHAGNTTALFHNWWQPEQITQVFRSNFRTVSIPDMRITVNTSRKTADL